jgi:hypothetical protein
MNSPRTTAGADLAADLMADLNTPLQDSAATLTVLPGGGDDPKACGRAALQFVVRVERRGLHWPSLRINRKFVSVSVGPMYLEAGTPSA